MDKKVAERTLREHKGDAVAAIRHLLHVGNLWILTIKMIKIESQPHKLTTKFDFACYFHVPKPNLSWRILIYNFVVLYCFVVTLLQCNWIWFSLLRVSLRLCFKVDYLISVFVKYRQKIVVWQNLWNNLRFFDKTVHKVQRN